ncbi:aspartyl/asparaginyl beta-hydroxylase domain-containing protein [Mucilaginibacter flavidus]|uniref:aspartyl/asparaginyl beta-hydroxylase domain-containing protein n=1 Tax=Mucilaginibacter flavidus TaxID=2949309 RepID=UPI0020927EAD|nr:aspartyl/asparaginyl beta-hydroxylase domain-containing protein [Mucilaginibacter flavidus]MCO5951173.1 aspartyl/asparaginyl beta-hydroxylase domain-containing protein [Mucilaginibacter flavidus]
MVRYAKLQLAFDFKATQAELTSARNEWQPHLNTYHYSGSWKVLSLRSPGGSHKNIIPDLIGESDFLDTEYMGHFASVKKIMASLHCPIMAVRFLNLQAGAIIKEHTDAELALEKGEARLHFPVFTNPQVEFYCEKDRIFLNEGECWYLNANLPHNVSNNGDTDRVHLVIDCKVNDWLKTIIESSGEIAYKKEEVDENMIKLIEELRYQNTETSNKLAAELEEKVKTIRAGNPAV